MVDLAGRLDLRHGLRLHGREAASDARRDPDLAAFFDEPYHFLGRPALRVLSFLLPAVALGAVAGLFFGLPSFVLYACLLVNAIVLLAAEKSRARIYALVAKTHAELRAYADILEDIERENFESGHLKGLREGLFKAGESASAAIDGLAGRLGLLEFRSAQVVYLVVNWLVLWDIHALFRLEAWRRAHADSVPEWFRTIAEFEALASLANAAFNHPDWTRPRIESGPFRLAFRGGGKPAAPRPWPGGQ